MTNNGYRFLLSMMLTAMVACTGSTEDESMPGVDAVAAEEPEGCTTADPSCTRDAEEPSTELAPAAILTVRKAGDDRRLD